jgi:hypothetical protein
MQAPQTLLNLMGIPLWIERGAVPLSPQNLIFLAEKKSAFSENHHAQLVKVLDYLGIFQYRLIYHGDPCEDVPVALALSFGAKDLPATINVQPYMTLSISDMLTNPSCKRQVMNDINPLKDNNT